MYFLEKEKNLYYDVQVPPKLQAWSASKLRLRNSTFVTSNVSFNSWGESEPLALAGHPSGDGATIKTK